MFVRHLRWTAACVAVLAAVALAPGRSSADVQILVEEIGSGGTVAFKYTSGVPNAAGEVAYSFNSPIAGSQFTLSGIVSTNSAAGTVNASFTPSFSGQLKPGVDTGNLNTLRITVTDDKFTGNTLPATLTNSAGVSRGFSGGTVQVDTFSRIYDPAVAPPPPRVLTPASSDTALADGATVSGPSPTASASRPNNPALVGDTFLSVTGLPGTYAIQQVITVSFVQTSTIPQSSTFGGSGGVSVDPQAVPAPGGVVLALIGLPLLGLRRVLRGRAA